jgi:enoyl-CoA hydratase/carnithine racemase
VSGRVGVEHDDAGVAVVTFDHVARHNALSLSMTTEGTLVLRELAGHPDVRVVVLRGAGERAFVAGADIAAQDDDAGRDVYVRRTRKLLRAVADVPVPVIAAVRGFCLGAGVALATHADVRLASDDAIFGVPAARLGLAYPYEEVARLVALAGAGAAADLLLSGRQAASAEALRWGLVQAVHPAAELDGAALELARGIARNAPLSVRAAKRAVRVAATGDGDRAAVDALVDACAGSADYAEGRAAFLERRTPRFAGR